MKICWNCKIEKPKSEFNKNKARKDGFATSCRECAKEFSKAYYKGNHTKHIKNVAKRNLEVKQKHKLVVDEIKAIGCKLCGEKETVCLDFHHINPEEKEYAVGKLLGYSTKTLHAEIDKCVVLCSNCHRKLHAGLITL